MSHIYSRDADSPVGIASYLVITEFQKARGTLPTGLYFNKIMSLLHSGMKADGTDMELPHCWYRWGDEVVRYLMPTDIGWNHEEPPLTTVSWDGDTPDLLDERVKQITPIVRDLTEKYSPEGMINEAVGEVYSMAPFQFQKDYKKCRDSLYDVMKTQVNWSDYANDVLWPCIETACESFPKEDFPVVAERLPAFRAIMEHLVLMNDQEPDYSLVKEISTEFWEWFCYYLRLHEKAHEYVPRTTLDYWSERLSIEDDRHERMMGDHILEFAKDDLALNDHPILGAWAKKRKDAADVEQEVISSFDDDFDGLDDFFRTVRHNYSPR